MATLSNASHRGVDFPMATSRAIAPTTTPALDPTVADPIDSQRLRSMHREHYNLGVDRARMQELERELPTLSDADARPIGIPARGSRQLGTER